MHTVYSVGKVLSSTKYYSIVFVRYRQPNQLKRPLALLHVQMECLT